MMWCKAYFYIWNQSRRCDRQTDVIRANSALNYVVRPVMNRISSIYTWERPIIIIIIIIIIITNSLSIGVQQWVLSAQCIKLTLYHFQLHTNTHTHTIEVWHSTEPIFVILSLLESLLNFQVWDIYLGMWPVTQVNSAWPSLRE